jgi:pantoate--beta-alanine ligase
MNIFPSTHDLAIWRAVASDNIGFVPTMGNLHAGHMSLLDEALAHHDTVVLSIFVNPTQFGPNEDFHRYPRTLKNDIALVMALAERYPTKEIVIYAPLDPKEIYREGFSTVVSVPSLSHMLEGEFRPGHFEGVATVVYLLLTLVKPRRAYFGQKDYQQCAVIKRMVNDLGLPVEVVSCPIIRDEHGLALSSRNQFLSTEDRANALLLSQTLQQMAILLDGKRSNIGLVVKTAEEIRYKDPRWQYLTLRDPLTLLDRISHPGKAVLLGLLKVGDVRLLDNLEVELQ